MNQEDKNNLINYRIERAKHTLNEVQVLVVNEYWNGAVNRLYYSSYYAVTALLLKENIVAQTHSGVRQMFGLHFIQTGKIKRELGKFYTDLFEKRQTGDYDDFIIHIKETLEYLLPSAKELIEAIEQILLV